VNPDSPGTAQRRARRPNRRGEGGLLREELIEAASAMIADTGHSQRLSLSAVARTVGVAATSVYLHFADVEQLKVAVAERGFAQLNQYRDAASHGITDPVQALLARCRAYCRFGLDHPGHYRLMFGPDLPAALAYDAEQAPGRHALQSLAASIQRCQPTRAGSRQDDPHRLATLVWASLHGVVSLRIDRPQFPWPASLDETADDIVRRLTDLRP
jgi:AcrR family transcriptional regulator